MPGTNLLGLSLEELVSLVDACNQRSYRARQLYRNLYVLRRTHFSEMRDLSKSFRGLLARSFEIELPAVIRTDRSVDGTEKLLLKLADDEKVEMVFIPEVRRNTFCISTQVGCNAGCRYCATATMGLVRNLTAGEIVGQVLLGQCLKPHESKELNVVFMGMGEPLLNYDASMKAFRLLADPQGMAIPARRITLSTCGIVPGLRRLAQEAIIPQVAISLAAPEDGLRSELIPVNRKWNLEGLLTACKALAARRQLTFEYTLIRDVNDSQRHARRLVKILHGLRCKMNLIPLNPHPLLPYEPPHPRTIAAFREFLIRHGVPTFIRQSRGEDIASACGQLAIQHSRKVGTDSPCDERLPMC